MIDSRQSTVDRRQLAVALAIVLVACGPTARSTKGADGANVVPEGKVEIAIYPATAIVRERRVVPLEKGTAKVRFDDMPMRLDPGSVRFESLSDPGGTRAVTQRVRQEPRPESDLPRWAEITGDPSQPVRLRGDTTRPVEHDPVIEGVTWTIASDSGGDQEVAVTYQTGGLSWRADYAIVLADDAGATADMNAWITVNNLCGRTFAGAALSFVVQQKEPPKIAHRKAPEPQVGGYGAYGGGYVPPQNYAPPAPPVPKYRSYAYPRKVDLEDGETRQLEWFASPLRGVASRKRIVFDPAGVVYDHDEEVPVLDKEYANDVAGAVSVSVELPAVARAMPPGRARVFQRGADGRLSLLGAAQVEHVDEGEPMRVQLGAVPGLTAKRRRTDFRADENTRRVIEGFEIVVKNNTDTAEKVVVREHLYRGARWEIPVSSQEYATEGKRAVTFEVDVPKQGKAKVRYRVVYSWDEKPDKAKGTSKQK